MISENISHRKGEVELLSKYRYLGLRFSLSLFVISGLIDVNIIIIRLNLIRDNKSYANLLIFSLKIPFRFIISL